MSFVEWLIITSEQIFVSDALSTRLISLFFCVCEVSAKFELKKHQE